jgi:hypothetical protein
MSTRRRVYRYMDKGVRRTHRVVRLVSTSLEHYQSELNLLAWAVCLAVAVALGTR